MPYQKSEDARGVRAKDGKPSRLRRVNVIEALAVPNGKGGLTTQIWLAMSAMSAFNPSAVPTWAGSGKGQCPPHGVETKLYVAEVPDEADCAERCELMFRDAGLTPEIPLAPDAQTQFLKNNPRIYKSLQAKYTQLKRDWNKINEIPDDRTHDDSPDTARRFPHSTHGRRRCYTGPVATYRKSNVMAMAFDVVSAVEKHVYFMDACGRILSGRVAGGIGEEQIINQQELAGAKCRERGLLGGASADGVGADAAFTPFYGKGDSGAGLSIYTDLVAGQKYLAVAEGWKGKLRNIKLGQITYGASPEALGTGPTYRYSWVTSPPPKNGHVNTLLPVVAPRKLSAGENDHVYVVTQGGLVLDVDLTPRPSCLDMRKVFPREMRNNPSTWWKHHFAFDTWLPDKDDASDKVCNADDGCLGVDGAGRPQCECDEGERRSSKTFCPYEDWKTCSNDACKVMGPLCNSTALSGFKKQVWAKRWWGELLNEKTVNHHGDWMHFTPKTLTKTLRYCLSKRYEEPPDPLKGVPMSPERKTKEIIRKNKFAREKLENVGESCHKDYGSWWSIRLTKKVQMLRHKCGDPDIDSAGRPTPGQNCASVYLLKFTRCIHQEGRPGAKPICCVDKNVANFLTPRLGEGKLSLPVELRSEVEAKLDIF
jgi:hypothetical protein